MEKTVQEAVAEKLMTLDKSVADVVVDKLVNIEVNRRVEIIISAINQQEKLEKELAKINKNDIVTYVEGSPVETMSKTRFDEIEKTKNSLNNLIRNINNALTLNTKDSYTKLESSIVK